MPTAITPSTVIWSITFRTLRNDRNVSVENDRKSAEENEADQRVRSTPRAKS